MICLRIVSFFLSRSLSRSEVVCVLIFNATSRRLACASIRFVIHTWICDKRLIRAVRYTVRIHVVRRRSTNRSEIISHTKTNVFFTIQQEIIIPVDQQEKINNKLIKSNKFSL